MKKYLLAATLSILAHSGVAQKSNYDKWQEFLNNGGSPTPTGPQTVPGGYSGTATAPPTHAAPDLPSYIGWQESVEGAFAVQVPQGWSIRGGVQWNTVYSVRQWIKASSPDQTMLVYVGDPAMLPRIAPNPSYAAMGWTDGQTRRTPAGTSVYMEPYRAGEQFAAEAATLSCPRPQSRGLFPLANETAQYSQALAPFRIYMKLIVRAGEFFYSCDGFDGYARAVTVGVQSTDIMTWDILQVAGFNASGGNANFEIARQVLLRMLSSWQVNLVWQQRVTQTLFKGNQVMMQANERLEATLLDSSKRAMESHSRIANKWSDIILGQQHMCDDLGNCQETSNRSDYTGSFANTFTCGPSDGSPPDARGWHLAHRT